MLRDTASVAALMTVIDAASRFTTQTSPFGASASVRGALPVAISATRALLPVSMTLTESLSGFTTHKRAAAPLRGSSSIGDEALARFAVALR